MSARVYTPPVRSTINTGRGGSLHLPSMMADAQDENSLPESAGTSTETHHTFGGQSQTNSEPSFGAGTLVQNIRRHSLSTSAPSLHLHVDMNLSPTPITQRSVCRNLFGAPDPFSAQYARQKLDEIIKKDLAKSNAYNFDFSMCQPLPGRYDWVPVHQEFTETVCSRSRSLDSIVLPSVASNSSHILSSNELSSTSTRVSDPNSVEPADSNSLFIVRPVPIVASSSRLEPGPSTIATVQPEQTSVSQAEKVIATVPLPLPVAAEAAVYSKTPSSEAASNPPSPPVFPIFAKSSNSPISTTTPIASNVLVRSYVESSDEEPAKRMCLRKDSTKHKTKATSTRVTRHGKAKQPPITSAYAHVKKPRVAASAASGKATSC